MRFIPRILRTKRRDRWAAEPSILDSYSGQARHKVPSCSHVCEHLYESECGSRCAR